MTPAIKKICVCSVQIPFVWGGSEYFYENLLQRVEQRGYEVAGIRLPLQTYPYEELIKGCFAWRLTNLDHIEGIPIDLVIATRFPSYMIPHKNKVIWLQHQYRQIYELYGTDFSGFTLSSIDTQLRQMLIDLDDLSFREAKKIYSQSRTVAARLKQFNGFESDILYPPINDSENFYYEDMQDYVLSVSRLAGNKRIHLLIEAMQYVSSRFQAVIVGEGFMEREYRELAAKLGLADRVHFAGRLSRAEVIRHYARAGAVFYGPLDEDYGYATLEAFYARKPVIACTDSGGVLEFVDETTGWVSEPSAQSIGKCIEEALSRKPLSSEKGNAGFERVSFINWDYVLDHLIR